MKFKIVSLVVDMDRNRPEYDLDKILNSILPDVSPLTLAPAQRLIEWLRPLGREQYPFCTDKFIELCDYLAQNEDIRQKWSSYLSEIIRSRNFTRMFTELGLPSEHSFFNELRVRVGYRILPPLIDPREALDLVEEFFGKQWDNTWLMQVSDEAWSRLFSLLFSDEQIKAYLKNELLVAIQIFAGRVSSLGLEPVLLERYPLSESEESAFLTLPEEVIQLVRKIEAGTESIEDQKHIRVLTSQCKTIVSTVKKKGKTEGVSIRLVYLLLRIEHNIERLEYFVSLLVPEEEKDENNPWKLFQRTVNDLHRRNSIRELFDDATGMLAYQVVEHNSHTGEHYITTNAREYWKFLWQSALGGAVIGVTTLIKMLIHHLHRAPLVETFLYSLNYAASFVVIYLGHFALATKQPSMTASALATALDDDEGRSSVDIEETGLLIIDMFRSQFISFAGNLATVYPAAILMSFLYLQLSGSYLADEDKAIKLLAEINPLTAPVLWYGALAGIFLFISGLFTGYLNNNIVFNKVPQRIRAHRQLNKWLGERRVNGIAQWTSVNWPGVAGNILLGFLLAFAGFLGYISGLPIDVRHITLSSGNFGVACFSLAGQLTTEQWILSILGIICIGLMNFSVSFGLSLALALRSRKVNFKESGQLMQFVLAQCVHRPFLLFLPPIRKKEK